LKFGGKYILNEMLQEVRKKAEQGKGNEEL